MNSSNLDQKEAKMKYKFKVGDKVKMTVDSHHRGLNRSIGLDQVMFVKDLNIWNSEPAYLLTEEGGRTTGIWQETEIEPFEKEKVASESSRVKLSNNVVKWALVFRKAPSVIDNLLFDTRREARNAKQSDYLGDSLKVVKIKITFEV